MIILVLKDSGSNSCCTSSRIISHITLRFTQLVVRYPVGCAAHPKIYPRYIASLLLRASVYIFFFSRLRLPLVFVCFKILITSIDWTREQPRWIVVAAACSRNDSSQPYFGTAVISRCLLHQSCIRKYKIVHTIISCLIYILKSRILVFWRANNPLRIRNDFE